MFGQRLKELRTDKGLSLKELGDALGLTSMTISRYENGKREPDFETLEKISEYFKVRIDWLVGKSNVKTYLESMVLVDMENIVKLFSESGENEEMTKILSNIIDRVFLICFHEVKDKNIEHLETFFSLLEEIWGIQRGLHVDVNKNTIDITTNSKIASYLVRKENVNQLIDKLFLDSLNSDRK